MKRLVSAAVLLALAVPVLQAGPVKVPDKNLEAALKAVLLEPKEGLTDENLVNVFVLNAAGNLYEDFHPAPDGFIAQRARQVLGESIDLLGQILDHDNGLLDAIADGTFGLMRRPADGGRGLDGVARKAADYYNPATEILEES